MLPIILAINDEQERSFVEDIYLKYRKKLYKNAFEILRNQEDSEDCLHDVIWKVIENLELFQTLDEESLIKLLIVCVRNTAINIYRKNKKRKLLVEKYNPYISNYLNEEEWPDKNLPECIYLYVPRRTVYL